MASIELPVSFDDIDQVFDLSAFLENWRELAMQFEPEVTPFLVKKDFFKGHFLIEYNKQFDDLIRSLIQKELISHFPSWTPEELLILTNIELLKLLAPKLFESSSYKRFN